MRFIDNLNTINLDLNSLEEKDRTMKEVNSKRNNRIKEAKVEGRRKAIRLKRKKSQIKMQFSGNSKETRRTTIGSTSKL